MLMGNRMAETEIEVTKAEYRETDEWEFRADVRTKLHNPSGSDIVVLRSYKYGPKYDDLVRKENHVHEHVEYWWPNSYPSQGDSCFFDTLTDWEVTDFEDDDDLLNKCVEMATIDPPADVFDFRGLEQTKSSR